MALTSILSREHQVVLGKLRQLEDALSELDLKVLEEVLRFMEGDLPLHRKKEEEVLFPALGRHIGTETGPIAVMLQEHEAELNHLRDLRAAVDDLKGGGDAGNRVRGSARAILELLRAHIRKEDEILFPMAEQRLTPEEHAEVARSMAAIGYCCPACSALQDGGEDRE